MRISILRLCQRGVAAEFIYVHSFVLHAYKALHTTLFGGPRFQISASFGLAVSGRDLVACVWLRSFAQATGDQP